MLLITKRRILRQIEKKRYCAFPIDKLSFNKDDYPEGFNRRKWRQTRGVEKFEFVTHFFYHAESVSFVKHPIKWIESKLTFFTEDYNIAVINDIIENSLDQGYLRPLQSYDDETIKRLKLTESGKIFVSRLYYLKLFYNNAHVQTIISTIITWGIPLIALWCLSHFFNISIESIS